MLAVISLTFVACNSSDSKTDKDSNALAQSDETVKADISQTEGYKLMTQKCSMCHFETMSPDKKSSMLAPPLVRLQEHYKPSYPTKEAFTKAVTAFLKNPTEDAVLMPGAARKFGLMPAIPATDEEYKLIAEALFDADFKAMPKMNKQKNMTLTLNDGKKRKLKPEAVSEMKKLAEQLKTFDSEDVTAYNQLGKDVFDNAKVILMDKDYTDDTFTQIKIFFHGIEDDIHSLIATDKLEDAKNITAQLAEKFDDFDNYFE